MGGRLRDRLPIPSLPTLPSWRPGPLTRMYGVLGLVVLTMVVSSAGVLSGLGLFLLAMISAAQLEVFLSSLLLTFSTAVLLLCYGWLTAE